MALASEHLVLGVAAVKDLGSQARGCGESQHQGSPCRQQSEA